MKRVYIAGPYSAGDVAANVRTAVFYADHLADLGYAPFVPHLSHFWHLLSPREYDFWLNLDLAYIPIFDAIYRIPGESPGADRETALADSLGIPVVHDTEELLRRVPA